MPKNSRAKGVTNNGFSDNHDLVLVPILFDNISLARPQSAVASIVGLLQESRNRCWESVPKGLEESRSTEARPVDRPPGIAMNHLDSARAGLTSTSKSSGTAPLPPPSPWSAPPPQPQPQTRPLQQPPPQAQPQPPPEPQPAPQPQPQAQPAPGPQPPPQLPGRIELSPTPSLERGPRKEKAPHVHPEEGGRGGGTIGGASRLEEEEEEEEEEERRSRRSASHSRGQISPT